MSGLLSGLVLTPLFRREYVPLIVRMYNPFIEQEHILFYLLSMSREGQKCWIEAGFWTCKTRYLVRLREDLRLRARQGLSFLPRTANGV